MTIKFARAASALLVVVALGACGSSAKHADPSADLGVAKAAVLKPADLSTYFAKPYQASNDTPVSVKQEFAKCLGVRVTILDDTPGAQQAHSPEFTKNSSSLSSSVEVDQKTSQVDDGWKELTGAKVTHCLSELFEAVTKLSAPAGVVFGPTTVTKFSPAIGDRSVGYTAKLSATSHGTSMVFYLDLLFVARDRTGIDLDASSAGQPFNRTTEIALARKMYERVGTRTA